MNTIDTGGPAFPSAKEDKYDESEFKGMDLRDYFAAKAMQAMWGNSEFMEAIANRMDSNMDKVRAGIAASAYCQADAMLAEREKARG